MVQEIKIMATEIQRNMEKGRITYLETSDGSQRRIKKMIFSNEGTPDAEIKLVLSSNREAANGERSVVFREKDFVKPSYEEYISNPSLKAFTYWTITESMKKDASVIIIRTLYKSDVSECLRFAKDTKENEISLARKVGGKE